MERGQLNATECQVRSIKEESRAFCPEIKNPPEPLQIVLRNGISKTPSYKSARIIHL